MQTALERFLTIAALFAAPLVATACAPRNSDDSDDSSGDVAADSITTDDTSTTHPDASTSSSSTGEDSGGTDSTGSAGESSTSESTGGDPLGNCCEPQVDAGCDATAVADCVCAEDPYCCLTQWDLHCVMEVDQLGCGECPSPPRSMR